MSVNPVVGRILILLGVICFAVAFAVVALVPAPPAKLWPELVALGLAFGFGGFLVPVS